MKIGIDIDNVISNFNDEILKEYIKHDKELRNTGIINENAESYHKGMFDWSKEENDEFYYSNLERISKNLKTITGAPETIKKLKEEGNEIIIISSRDNGIVANPREMTENWLKENDIVYDKLIVTGKNQKGDICKENNVYIMIDDSIKNCEDVRSKGIKVLLMDTRYNKNTSEFERVSNWKEIYEKIQEMYSKEDILKIRRRT